MFSFFFTLILSFFVLFLPQTMQLKCWGRNRGVGGGGPLLIDRKQRQQVVDGTATQKGGRPQGRKRGRGRSSCCPRVGAELTCIV